jgi:hypothetical protein
MPRTLTQTQMVHALADMGNGYAAVLFGAGASRSSGVLLAREIVHDLCLTAYCREFDIGHAQCERVTSQEVRAWVELQAWYQHARANGETDYSATFRQFKPTHDHQVEYIRGLLKRASPSPAYKLLAQLAHEGRFQVLCTTNFDPLLENCYSGLFPSEASLRSVATDSEFSKLTLSSGLRVLAYLHGNLNGYQIANLDEETRLLRPETESALRRLLNPHALVVVGYSGWDKSVMSLLQHLASNDPSAFRRGVVYWCRQPESMLSPLAEAFLNQVAQGMIIEIHGFDRLMLDLARAFGHTVLQQPIIGSGLSSDGREIASESAVLNISEIDQMPTAMLKIRTGLKSRRDVDSYRDEYSWWQATIDDGFLWLIGDLSDLPDSLRSKCSDTIETIPLTHESLSNPLQWNIFSELSNKALNRTLLLDHQLRCWKDDRYFFAKLKNADERSIKYYCRQRMSTRRVVWCEFERGTEDQKTRYFSHEAIRARVLRFRERPVVRFLPTRLFTVEGKDVWDSQAAHTSVGRSTGKVWNQWYDALVRLWLEVLSRGSDRVNIRFNADARKDAYRCSFLGIPTCARRVRQ